MKLQKSRPHLAGVVAVLGMAITVVALRDGAERDTVTLGVGTRGSAWKMFDASSPTNGSDGVALETDSSEAEEAEESEDVSAEYGEQEEGTDEEAVLANEVEEGDAVEEASAPAEGGSDNEVPDENATEEEETPDSDEDFDVTGNWVMVDNVGKKFAYVFEQTGPGAFKGNQANVDSCKIKRGLIEGDQISWQVNNVVCEGRLTTDSEMIFGGVYFEKDTGMRLGTFTGERQTTEDEQREKDEKKRAKSARKRPTGKKNKKRKRKSVGGQAIVPERYSKPYANEVVRPESWLYNPFRKYFGHGHSTLSSDMVCPSMDVFAEARKNMTLGEGVMCQIRYTTLLACNLPETTCTICNCEKPNEMEAAGAKACVPRTCYMKLPFIWAQWYLLVPIAVLAVHVLVSPVLNAIYIRLMRIKPVSAFVIMHIGTADAAPEKINLRVYLLVIQIIASGLNVFLYCVLNLYDAQYFPWQGKSMYIPQWNSWLQFFLNVQMLINFTLTWSKNGFSHYGLLGANPIIDLMTVHSTLIRQICYTLSDPPISKSWNVDVEKVFLSLSRPQMTWQFLRSYRCLSALMEIQSMGALSQFSPVQTQFMKSGLRLWALVNLFTGAIQVIEWLGHDLSIYWMDSGTLASDPLAFQVLANKLKYLGDCQTQTDLRDGSIACVPFVVGIYWVFTTISSVGYGDYGPVSAPTYLLVIFFIVAGVTFFSVETQTLLDVIEEQGSGIRAADTKGVHVVLTGGAMRDVDTSILQPFIAQLFHRAVVEQGGEWPELVILGKVKDHQEVNDFIADKLSGDMARNTHFCNYDPLTPHALRMAKVDQASIVYIAPSTLTGDVQAEDEYNTNVALSVKSLTKTPFRLVLFRMESISIARSAGIHPGQCCSINDMRSSILAQATRVRGWAHLLTLMTNNVLTNIEGARKFCHDALFPSAYYQGLCHTIRGFALNKYVAGAEFHELALSIYRETGALAICMLSKDDRLLSFPWNEVATPNSIVFCLHSTDFVIDPKAKQFVSEIDWQQQLVKLRKKKETVLIDDGEDGFTLDYESKEDETATDEDMEHMKVKANGIKARKEPFVLVVMTEHELMWPMLGMYLQKFLILADTASGGSWGVIVLTNAKPPMSLLTKVKALDRQVPVAFVDGLWHQPGHLRDAGAELCKVLLAFPVTNELSAEPEQDTRIFFLMEILRNLNLRKETLVLLELGSGTSGAHVLPAHEETPTPPSRVGAEIAFNPSMAGGSVYVPRMIVGLLAKTFYTFGILEVFQSLVTDSPDPNAARPEQITVPRKLIGRSYGHAVESFLQKRIGPTPALLMGILRETLEGEVAVLKPERNTHLLETDLLFLLMDQKWSKWADENHLRCMGGRKRRSFDSRVSFVDVMGPKAADRSQTVRLQEPAEARTREVSMASLGPVSRGSMAAITHSVSMARQGTARNGPQQTTRTRPQQTQAVDPSTTMDDEDEDGSF